MRYRIASGMVVRRRRSRSRRSDMINRKVRNHDFPISTSFLPKPLVVERLGLDLMQEVGLAVHRQKFSATVINSRMIRSPVVQ